METYFVLKDLAILLLFAKIFALIARRIKCPQVVGQIMAGLLVGPCCLGWVQTSDFLAQIAEIGVVLLMFITGLETDLKKLLKAGPIALLVAVMGVAVPLVCGIGVYGAFYGLDEVGSPQFYKAVFIGVILTATSVSITVAALQEMGKINSFLGTTIIGAAVIDDVIGVIVLTCAIGMSTGSGGLGKVLLNTFLFFLISGVGGFLVYHLAKWYYGKHTRTHRVTI
ncbi:MAG: cation:proton antiporter, partial [Lachnospiraceae bacterium]|nr:cation:proton antiporter [Lachnospiraceae bacterium]